MLKDREFGGTRLPNWNSPSAAWHTSCLCEASAWHFQLYRRRQKQHKIDGTSGSPKVMEIYDSPRAVTASASAQGKP
ncbi:MAG: hypothetical protein ACRETL_06065, partial [Gammaproteobacteria bacterium]